jgi:hypothetical protein
VQVASNSLLLDGQHLLRSTESDLWETKAALPPGRYVFHFLVNGSRRMVSPLHESDGDENVVVAVDELHSVVSSFCEHAAQLPTARFLLSTPSSFDLFSLS